jgi:hypothetical protein
MKSYKKVTKDGGIIWINNVAVAHLKSAPKLAGIKTSKNFFWVLM